MNFTNLDEMIRSREYEGYISDRLGNDLFINDPERAERIQVAASYGSDGSMHSEIIDDWRDFLSLQDIFYNDEVEDFNKKEFISKENHDKIAAEIDACEKFHEAAGTLYKEVG